MVGLDLKEARRLVCFELAKKTDSSNPNFEAEQLVLYAANAQRIDFLLSKKVLDKDSAKLLEEGLNRRIKGEPLQYIIGEWEFYSLPFFVGEGVLIPRQDTELLVDCALDFLENKSEKKIIDLGSGSGCIAISVEKNAPQNEVFALEKYDEAFSYLIRNVKKNNSDIKPIKGDVFEPVGSGYDLILSNPPYITKSAMQELQREVTFEPETALYGGEDGLDFYKAILKLWTPLLNVGGAIMFEVGYDQEFAVKSLMENAGLCEITSRKDINGISRVIIGTRNA